MGQTRVNSYTAPPREPRVLLRLTLHILPVIVVVGIVVVVVVVIVIPLLIVAVAVVVVFRLRRRRRALLPLRPLAGDALVLLLGVAAGVISVDPWI